MGSGWRVVVAGDDALVSALSEALAEATVRACDTAADAIERFEAVDAAVTDHRPPARDALAVVEAAPDTLPVVVAPEHGSSQLATEALGAGATDYVDRAAAGAALGERVARAVRRAGERRRRSETLEQYETIVETVPDAVYAVDEVGTLTFANQRALAQFGFSAAEVESGSVHFEDTVADEDVERLHAAVRELLSADGDRDGTTTVEHTAVTEGGRRFPVENHFAVMPSEDGVAGAGILRDVSDRRQRERRLDVLDRVLRHNIRNELTAVINLADAIEIETDRESVAEDAAAIRELSRDLARMSDRIRELAAVVEEGRPDEGHVDAVTAVEDAVAELAGEYPEATVETDLPEALPVAATGALAVAVEELLVNAVEHNDHADPTVRVTAADSDRPGEWVDIRVEDDGPGIPETERAVVEDDEITPLQHGSGLGLWAVVWIAESFHGDVSVADNEPRGTVVTIQVQRRDG